MIRARTGQSTVEYAVLAVVVVAALLAMQIYLKRGAMGRLKDATDQQGEQFTPMNTTMEMDTSYQVTRTEDGKGKGVVESKIDPGTPEKRERGKGTGSVKVTTGLDKEPL